VKDLLSFAKAAGLAGLSVCVCVCVCELGVDCDSSVIKTYDGRVAGKGLAGVSGSSRCQSSSPWRRVCVCVCVCVCARACMFVHPYALLFVIHEHTPASAYGSSALPRVIFTRSIDKQRLSASAQVHVCPLSCQRGGAQETGKHSSEDVCCRSIGHAVCALCSIVSAQCTLKSQDDEEGETQRVGRYALFFVLCVLCDFVLNALLLSIPVCSGDAP